MDKTPNNKFQGNPGIMNDGRLFTDHRPNRDIVDEINQRALGHNHQDHMLRQYLQKNAKSLMDSNYTKTLHHTHCKDCYRPQNVGELIPGANYFDEKAFLDFVARPKNMM